IARSASALSSSLSAADTASRTLGLAGLTHEQLAVIEKMPGACLAGGARPVLSPLEQGDREDSIAEWLRDHSLESSMAEDLAEADVSFEMLEQLAHSMKGTALPAAVHWIAATCATRHLASEIQEAASRISGLVSAIKGFTQMDRATVPEPVDI